MSAPRLTTGTTVSPSPQELVAALPAEECVAIDLLLQEATDRDLREAGAVDIIAQRPATLSDTNILKEDPRLVALVPDEKRRRYLGTLTVQLRALGFSLQASPDLDAACREWQAASEAWRRLDAERAETARRAAEEQRQRDEALPPEARRAVQRRRRRQERRRNR